LRRPETTADGKQNLILSPFASGDLILLDRFFLRPDLTNVPENKSAGAHYDWKSHSTQNNFLPQPYRLPGSSGRHHVVRHIEPVEHFEPYQQGTADQIHCEDAAEEVEPPANLRRTSRVPKAAQEEGADEAPEKALLGAWGYASPLVSNRRATEDAAVAAPALESIDIGGTLMLKNARGEGIQVAHLANKKGGRCSWFQRLIHVRRSSFLFSARCLLTSRLRLEINRAGCMTQACAFGDVYPDFSSLNFDVYCLSAYMSTTSSMANQGVLFAFYVLPCSLTDPRRHCRRSSHTPSFRIPRGP
jgi:hypothetical protein